MDVLGLHGMQSGIINSGVFLGVLPDRGYVTRRTDLGTPTPGCIVSVHTNRSTNNSIISRAYGCETVVVGQRNTVRVRHTTFLTH